MFGEVQTGADALKVSVEHSPSRRILIVGLNYAPDMVGVAKYTTELADELARRGHRIEVVAGPPYYPAWKIPEGYSGRRGGRETLGGVVVHRTPLYVPAQPSGLKRLVHLASFGLAAARTAVAVARRLRPELVLSIAPTLTSSTAALVAAKAARARSWLHIQDFEVDAAFELGLLKSPGARKAALAAERALLRRFDAISSISPNMVALARTKSGSAAKVTEVRNWVDLDAVPALPSTWTSYRKEMGIPPEAVVALYSGNMAGKQGLEHLASVAQVLEREIPGAVMLLCGQGPARAELERACASRTNVKFLDLQPSARLPELLATADIHLLPQKAEAADLVLPSKLTGMLASGRPVVAMAAPGTSLAGEVEGCGLSVLPDASSMTQGVLALARDPELRARLGAAARRRAEERWSMRAIIDGFEAQMQALVGAETR